MENLSRKLRVTYFDPDATDSSSDEQSVKTQKNSKKKVLEIVFQTVKNLEKKKKKLAKREAFLPKSNIVGVHRRRSGKYSSEIKDPFTKKKIWLGTFTSPEDASRAYLAKKREIQTKLRSKNGVNSISREKSASLSDQKSPSLSDQKSPSCVLEIETSDSSNFVENKVSEDEDVRFGFLCGVQIVDQNGFFVGDFGKIDDLSICTVGDGIFCQDMSFDVK